MKTTSLETSRRLVGKVNIETEWYWCTAKLINARLGITQDCEPYLIRGHGGWVKEVLTPAYTTDELMELLPAFIEKDGNLYQLTVWKMDIGGYEVAYVNSKTQWVLASETGELPEALALLAEYLVDNGIYKGKE